MMRPCHHILISKAHEGRISLGASALDVLFPQTINLSMYTRFLTSQKMMPSHTSSPSIAALLPLWNPHLVAFRRSSGPSTTQQPSVTSPANESARPPCSNRFTAVLILSLLTHPPHAIPTTSSRLAPYMGKIGCSWNTPCRFPPP